jgi:hypothetical protein
LFSCGFCFVEFLKKTEPDDRMAPTGYDHLHIGYAEFGANVNSIDEARVGQLAEVFVVQLVKSKATSDTTGLIREIE